MRLFGYDIGFRVRKEARAASTVCKPDGDLFEVGRSTLAGINVSEKNVLSIPAVWTAVNTVSRTLASLPFGLYEKTDDGSKEATGHPCHYVTKHEPAPMTTGYNFRRALFARACLGDVTAEVRRNGIGRPTGFRIMADCRPVFNQEGDLYYLETTPQGKQKVYMPYEVLHLKALTLDGMVAEDLIGTHKDTFALSLAATQYGGAFFGNGAHVSGVISSPNGLDTDQIRKLREGWDAKYSGVRKTGKTAVLDNGMTYDKIGLTPEEAMLTETRTFQVRETARIFGMPLHLFQDLGDTTFNNIESMGIQFVNLCLRPWAVEYEQEMWMKTLTENERRADRLFYRMNLNGLLRGDTKTRAEYYRTLANLRVLNPNEIREMENMNRREGGDEYMMQTNMMPESEMDNDGGQEDTNSAPEAAPAKKQA